MSRASALRLIKALRDAINDQIDDPNEALPWINDVCDNLDRAADVIEFPK